ncbi:unnamed protein product [Symbiodinium natans]|uniref:RING-type domain-containing protein n=1 Tax=Symbiodinium natans TaxID=878477 RepID=A0A812TC32_9DINO|nr:unnamed protein product [Symbiodinium natans]
MGAGHAVDVKLTATPLFVCALQVLLPVPALGQTGNGGLGPIVQQADAKPGTLHWALAIILIVVLLVGLFRSYRILKQTQHLTVVRHAPEGMRIVECGSCRTAQYVSAHGRIFICCSCHCANRIPMDAARAEELIVADGPLKKFEFKKGGENFWQEVSQEELEEGAEASPEAPIPQGVDKPAPSLIGKVDMENASTGERFPQCVVCLDEPGCMVLLPCAHGGVCEACVTRIVQNRAFGGSHCPHCRSTISTIVKLQEVEGELAKGVELRIPMALKTGRVDEAASCSTLACAPLEVPDDLEVQTPAIPLSKASDIVFREALHEDVQGGGARHAPAVSKMWSNIPAHVRESFRAPASLEDAPKPSAPLLLDNVMSKFKNLVTRVGFGPAKWSEAARPYYQGKIPLAPYQKGQTAAYNYPPFLVPRELAHRFPLDMYVDPIFQTSDAAQRIRMRGVTLFPRLQGKTTLLLVFSGQPLSGLWTGLRSWIEAAKDFHGLPNTQVLKLHCEEGWFSRRTHQLTKFQLRRQVDESELWTTFVYRGKWKWEYERALHLYNKELPVVLLLDAVGYVRWHAGASAPAARSREYQYVCVSVYIYICIRANK